MKDFDRWFRESTAVPLEPIDPDESDLPENIRFNGGTGDDKYHARCCCCDNWGPLYCGIDELQPLDDYEHYCNGSDRCCP